MPTPRKRPLRPLVIIDSHRLTPHLVRLVLEGDTLADFPPDCGGGYIKFGFDADGQPVTGTEVTDDITLRTYTIRALDTKQRQLTVDFVLHGDGSPHDGPASAFARMAQPGDRIGIAGPGGVKALDPTADWYLVAGDMTAMPAIAAKLDHRARLGLPIRGYLVVEVLDKADAEYLSVPEGLELTVVVNPNPADNTDALMEAVRELPWREGRPFAWCAAEFSRMRGFRDYVRGVRDIGLEDRYISSYWMLDRTEEGHKVEKRRDAEHDEATAGASTSVQSR